MKKCFIFFITIFFILITNCFIFSFSLNQAIIFTLNQNSNILINKEIVKSSEAQVSISKSKFDTILDTNLSYNHSESPITESQQRKVDTFSSGRYQAPPAEP